MALFSMDIGIEQTDDLKKVKSYLYMLDEELRYMFSNLTPEDNWNDSAKLIFAENNAKIATLEVSVDGIVANVQDNETNYNTSMRLLSNLLSLNASTPDESSSIVLTGDRIALTTGKFVINATNSGKTTFSVDQYGNATFGGNLNAAGGTFSGTVTASVFNGVTINGATIHGTTSISSGDQFLIYSGDASQDAEMILGDFTIAKSQRGSRNVYGLVSSDERGTMAIWADGTIWCNDIYPIDVAADGEDDWFDGWSLIQTVIALWDCVKAGSRNPANYNPW